MATNLITVKDVQEKSKDGSSWLELTDENNRTHRIFRRVQDNDGNWHDLSSKYDMIRNSENRTLRLTTEQKGRFINVLDVEPVEPAQTRRESKSSEERDAECRLKTFTTAYAKDLAVAGKIPTDTILSWAELFYRYLQGGVSISDTEVNEAIKKARAIEEQPAPKSAARRAAPARPVESLTP